MIRSKNSLAAVLIFFVLYSAGWLASLTGFPHNIVFPVVLMVFEIPVVLYIRKRLIDLGHYERAVKIGLFGFILVQIVVCLILIFDYKFH